MVERRGDAGWGRWAGTHRARPSLSPRAARIAAGVLVALGALSVWTTARRVAEVGPWGALHLLTSPMVVFGALWVLQRRRSPMTRFDDDGITTRVDLFRTGSVAWADVERVEPPGRFDEHPVARLAAGGRLVLPGFPAEAAAAMAATNGPAPSERTSARAADGDLDGPFRRG